jgi:hypothetical protein
MRTRSSFNQLAAIRHRPAAEARDKDAPRRSWWLAPNFYESARAEAPRLRAQASTPAEVRAWRDTYQG